MTANPATMARAAFGRHDWSDAFAAYQAADADEGLAGEDLEAFALAAFFVAQPDLVRDLLERAFRRREADGEQERAAYLAVRVAREHWWSGNRSMASGWLRRAERLIGSDGDGYAHGYLALASSEQAAAAGDASRAQERAERAVAIAERSSDADLRAWAWSNLGGLKIAAGDTQAGVGLLEEASLAAVNGELSPFTGGITACRMIGACRDLSDYRRAAEWIEATERYCRRQSLEGFPGVCRIHRAEVASVAGDWRQAEEDLRRATVELERYRATPPIADGYYALGEVRRLRGDFEGAEAALREAHARGRTPEPALALIRLAQGDIRAAAVAIETALAEQTSDVWARARLLPARVEIALADGATARARTAADELAGIVSGYPSPAWDANVHVARGRVLLGEGDLAGATRELRLGTRAWQEVGSPYEVARARLVLARVFRALDAVDDAALELRAALDTFRSLGALPDLAAAEREVHDLDEGHGEAPSSERTFLFTDNVGSTALAESVGDDVWTSVLRWHDATLRDLIARGSGRVVKSTGDGFFAVFESARDAVDTAIAIQRTLRGHRRDSGYPARVRIGIHTGEATERGGDYTGLAVHVAARVAALAQADEVVASATVLAAAESVATGVTRTVTVKGVREPVAIASVVWV